jgi:hypothetical protein
LGRDVGTSLSAQDSQYREFQLGMSLAAAAQKSGVTPEARVPHLDCVLRDARDRRRCAARD